MLRLFYQHYRKFLLWVLVGMAVVNGIALTVYYSDNSINEKFNTLMMFYSIGVVTVLPFAVTFDAVKRLKAILPYKGGTGTGSIQWDGSMNVLDSENIR